MISSTVDISHMFKKWWLKSHDHFIICICEKAASVWISTTLRKYKIQDKMYSYAQVFVQMTTAAFNLCSCQKENPELYCLGLLSLNWDYVERGN